MQDFSEIAPRVCTFVLSIILYENIWENYCFIKGLSKRILGCSSKTCTEAGRGVMGLDTLQSCRDRAKLIWWYKLVTLPENRYPKQLFN